MHAGGEVDESSCRRGGHVVADAPSVVLQEIQRPVDDDPGKVVGGPRVNRHYCLAPHDVRDLMNFGGRLMRDRRVRKYRHRCGDGFPKTTAHPRHPVEAFVNRGPYPAIHSVSDRRLRETEISGLLVAKKSTLPAAEGSHLVVVLHPANVTEARTVV